MIEQEKTNSVRPVVANFNLDHWEMQYPLSIGKVTFDIQSAPPAVELIDATRLALVREKSRKAKTWRYLIAAIIVSLIPAFSNNADFYGSLALAALPIITFIVSLLIFARQDESCRIIQDEIELLDPIEAKNAQAMADLLHRYDNDGQRYKSAVIESGRPFINAELLMLHSYATQRSEAASLASLYKKEA